MIPHGGPIPEGMKDHARIRTGLVVVAGLIVIGCGGSGAEAGSEAPDAPAPVASAATTTQPVGASDFEPRTAPALVGADGGTVISPDGGLVLDIPPGALHEPVEIALERVAPLDRLVLIEYDLGPDGLQFSAPVSVTIRYGELPDGVSADDLEVVHITRGEASPIADRTPSADGGGFVVTLHHFSRLVIRLPEMEVMPSDEDELMETVLTGVQEDWPVLAGPDGSFAVTAAVTFTPADETWTLFLKYDQDFKEPVVYGNFGDGSALVEAKDFLGLERGELVVSGRCLVSYNGQLANASYTDVAVPFTLQSRAGEPPRPEDTVTVTFNPDGGMLWGRANEDVAECPIFDSPVTVPIVLKEVRQLDLGPFLDD